MKTSRILVLLFIITVLFFLPVIPALSATQPDIPDKIHQLKVTLSPEPDGEIKIKYDIEYEVITDFRPDLQHLIVNVPNSEFQLEDFGPDQLISKASEIRYGDVKEVCLDFARLPKSGDRMNINFTFSQRSMINKSFDNVYFEFTPSRFYQADIENLQLAVEIKKLANAQLKPKPDVIENGMAIWTTRNLKVNHQAPQITITCSRDSFPYLSDSDIKTNFSAGGIFSIDKIIIYIILYIMIIGMRKGIYAYPNGRYLGGYRGQIPDNNSSFWRRFL